MQTVSRPILLLHSDPALGDLLLRLSGGPYHVQRVPDWATLGRILRATPPLTLVVVDPWEPGEGAPKLADDLRGVLGAAPGLTVVAALRIPPADAEVVTTLLDWGVADWIDLDREDTPAAVVRRLRTVEARPVERLIARALPRGVPSRSRALLTTAALVVARGGQVPDLAAALGVTTRTVPRWFARADLPAPRRLLAWLRLLIAADLLDDPRRSIESIARGVGYAGAAALKTGLRNIMGMTPQELRDRGAFKTVAGEFSDELRSVREASRTRGRRPEVWLN
jgi:AraC-like DNA-binding protein